MKILLDVCGGDAAPEAPLEVAAIALAKHKDLHLVLAGPRDTIETAIKEKKMDASRIEILNAKEPVLNTDHPAMFLKQKPESSLAVAYNALHGREDIDALISAGPTGALLTGAVLKIGRIPGVKRPALITTLPGGAKLLDSGANMDCKPEYLEQFAEMGNIYMKILGKENPRIGLLSVGKEEGKGDELTKAAYELLKAKTDMNFIGNVEGDAACEGACDVVVCDGFAGNVFIKAGEGAAMFAMNLFKKALKRNALAKFGALFQMKGLKEAKATFKAIVDSCAPLLGTKKLVMKCHGKAQSHVFVNTIEETMRLIDQGLIASIEKAVASTAPEAI